MLSFYSIVIIIAIIILVIALTVIGITLSKNKNTKEYPEYPNTCPDFWSLDNTMCKPMSNINTPSPDRLKYGKPSHDGVTLDINKTKITSIDINDSNWVSHCDKANWTKKNGILWDGITNNNTCT